MNDKEKASGNIQIGNVGENFSGNISISQNVNQPQPASGKPADEPEQASPAQREMRNRLFKGLNKYFSEAEVKELCFELGVEYADLEGDTRRGKNRALVGFYERQNRLEELQGACREARPAGNW